MYADKITESIRKTVEVTRARRQVQEEYNLKNGITPTTVKRGISLLVEDLIEGDGETEAEFEKRFRRGSEKKLEKESENDKIVSYPTYKKHKSQPKLRAAEEKHPYMTLEEIQTKIKEHEKEMKRSAKEMRYEDAARHRDHMRKFQKMIVAFG